MSARALLPALLLTTLLLPAPAAAVDVATPCEVAADLTEAAQPRAAVAAVTELRKATGEATACATEYADAVATQARAAALAARAEEQLRDDQDDAALATAERALDLDADDAEALAVRDEVEAARTKAEETSAAMGQQSRWEELRTQYVDPWGALLRDTLLLLVLLLALARVLAWWLPKLGRRDADGNRPAERLGQLLPQRGTAAVLVVLLAACAASVVGATAASGFLRGPTVGALLPSMLLLVVLLALRWCAGRTLAVTTAGAAAPEADEVHALIRSLAPEVPAGAERPAGTDAAVFADVSVVSESSVPWVVALRSVLDLLRPPTPWRLRVQSHGDGAVSYELHRNGARLTGGMARPEEVRSVAGLADDDETTFDLTVFPAAQAVMRVARATGTTGLAGATGSKSLAYQYLAACQGRSSEAAKALAAHAVGLDARNTLALVGYWHALYREETTAERLRAYVALLDGLLDGPAARRLEHEDALRLRVRFTALTADVNLLAVERSEAHRPGESEEQRAQRLATRHERLRERLRELSADFAETGRRRRREQGDPGGGSSRESARTVFERRLLALGASVDLPERLPGPLSPEPERHSPAVNYSLACAFAASDPVRSVRHLRLADVDPTLRSWRERDPQLATLRRTPAYLEEFGAAAQTDLLALEALAADAAALRSVGLVTAERLAAASALRMLLLGLSVPRERWVRGLARTCRDLARPGGEADDLAAAWAVTLTGLMAARGWVAPPTDGSARQGLVDELVSDLEGHHAAPSREHLETWLEAAARR